MRKQALIMAVAGVLSCTGAGYGMATMETGPDSERGHPTVEQPSWPAGLVALPRHESRVYSVWVNGSETFYFKANPEEINQLISLFAKVRLRDHVLSIKPEKERTTSFAGEEFDANVSLHVPGGITRHFMRKDGNPDTFEPVLAIYVNSSDDRAPAGQITLPGNIIVDSEVPDFPLKGKATRPERKLWYGQVQFEDKKPATDFEHDVITRVTLWEKGNDMGIKLDSLDKDGYFQAAFSDREIADQKEGRSWLTLTAGNPLTEAKPDHPKLIWKHLATGKEKVEPVTIARPVYYYGRLLFEDGSPVNAKAWLGREVLVDFPYAGSADVDAEGYFQVCFTGDQYEKAKAGKPRKNVYIPSSDEWNTSTARFVFPVSKLSHEKQNAGVVRIPEPTTQPAKTE